MWLSITSIVFVHGLQGHPEKTWTYFSPPVEKKRWLFGKRKDVKPQESQDMVFWPFDLLSKHPGLASARILTWGYDSQVSKFFNANNQQNISRHGNNLMVALQQERKDNVRASLF
jgi:hypothetical protein